VDAAAEHERDQSLERRDYDQRLLVAERPEHGAGDGSGRQRGAK
jgi:hypothetical protein